MAILAILNSQIGISSYTVMVIVVLALHVSTEDPGGGQWIYQLLHFDEAAACDSVLHDRQLARMCMESRGECDRGKEREVFAAFKVILLVLVNFYVL